MFNWKKSHYPGLGCLINNTKNFWVPSMILCSECFVGLTIKGTHVLCVVFWPYCIRPFWSDANATVARLIHKCKHYVCSNMKPVFTFRVFINFVVLWEILSCVIISQSHLLCKKNSTVNLILYSRKRNSSAASYCDITNIILKCCVIEEPCVKTRFCLNLPLFWCDSFLNQYLPHSHFLYSWKNMYKLP